MDLVCVFVQVESQVGVLQDDRDVITRKLAKCNISCLFKLARCANALSHVLHLNGWKKIKQE